MASGALSEGTMLRTIKSVVFVDTTELLNLAIMLIATSKAAILCRSSYVLRREGRLTLVSVISIMKLLLDALSRKAIISLSFDQVVDFKLK